MASPSFTEETGLPHLFTTDILDFHPLYTSDPHTFNWKLQDAKKECPDLEPSVALNTYVREYKAKGIFFTDDGGERGIYCDEIRYSIMKGHNGGKGLVEMYAKTRDGRRGDNRKYVCRRYPLTLRQINRPKREEIAELVRHPSEGGWNLRVGHVRHFDSFPTKIKRLIFGFALTVQSPYFVQPYVVTCNWVRMWSPSDHGVSSSTRYVDLSDQHKSTIWIPRQDHDGLSTEIRRIYRKPIDASFLRTSRAVWEVGKEILYGGNELFFSMNNPGCLSSPPSLMPRGRVYRPSATKPEKWEDWKEQVDKIISQIENQVPLCRLTGWVYYDLFLRFLYTIGPKNARLLKSLKFEGKIKLHLCSIEDHAVDEHCDDDLVWSLRLYIPFIKKFCTAVERLTLYVVEDRRSVSNIHFYPADHPLTYQEALLSLLCNEMREIETLKDIAILPGGWKPEENDMDLEFVAPAVQWFQEQTRKRAYDAVEETRLKLEAEETAKTVKLTCGFCGEEHVWAECYNLCSVCGEFGHFRRTCPMRKL